MQISTKGRYGLRAMVDLAFHATAAPMPLHIIALRQGISDAYLEQIFSTLRKTGIVKAVRGAQGGYQLARPAVEISAGEILRALEGPLVPVHCVDDSAPIGCGRARSCITRGFWAELRDHINTFLDQTTLQDLLDRIPKDREPMYYI
jgi:Rrf2 family cysteine metabolism transcriptional repressor